MTLTVKVESWCKTGSVAGRACAETNGETFIDGALYDGQGALGLYPDDGRPA
jgi:hypothetical protein